MTVECSTYWALLKKTYFFIYLPKTLKNKQNINKHSFSLRKVTTQTQILLVSLQQDNISKNGCNDYYYLLKQVFI